MKYSFTLPGRGPMATPENLGIIARHGSDRSSWPVWIGFIPYLLLRTVLTSGIRYIKYEGSQLLAVS